MSPDNQCVKVTPDIVGGLFIGQCAIVPFDDIKNAGSRLAFAAITAAGPAALRGARASLLAAAHRVRASCAATHVGISAKFLFRKGGSTPTI